MKNSTQNLLNFLLLQVLFLATAGNCFAFSKPVLDLDSRQGEYFKSDQNGKGLLFEEVNHTFNFQSQSEKDSDGFSSFLCGHLSERNFSNTPAERFIFGITLDKKNILKHQIFPFHFFW